MKLLTSTSLLTIAVLLSACGGSSSGGSAFTETGPITVPNLNAAGEEIFDFLVAAEADDISAISTSDLVAQGSATYSGFMIAEPDGSGEALVGRTSINANFTNGGSLTGSVTDLALFPEGNTDDVVDDDDEDDLTFEPIPSDAEITQLDGSLTLSNGSIRTVNGFGVITMDVAGDVTVPGSFIDGAGSDDVEFDVTGQLDGLVAETGELVAEGNLNAATSVFDFDLDTIIFAE